MISDERILKLVTIEDLNNDSKFFAEFLEIETVKKILLFAGGSTYYFPQPSSLVESAVKKHLIDHPGNLDYFAIKKIEKEFNISQKKLAEIIRDIKKIKKEEVKGMF